ISAHCPNPGRLDELLFPGAPCILEAADNPERKLPYTLAAVIRNAAAVPLYSARANDLARKLILPVLFPHALEVRREYSMGSSRFDFLVSGPDDIRHIVEVKHCSLVEYKTAMFPDAPSARALKHLKELMHIRTLPGHKSHLIFVIGHGSPERLCPNIHTDPAFALAVHEARQQGVAFHCVSTVCDRTGAVEIENLNTELWCEPLSFLSNPKGFCITLWSTRDKTQAQHLKKEWIFSVAAAPENCLRNSKKNQMPASRVKDIHIGELAMKGVYPVFTDYVFSDRDADTLINSGIELVSRCKTPSGSQWIFRSFVYPFYIEGFRQFFFMSRHWGHQPFTDADII
ncbi:MAG: DNA/RNA nuclease SfsA, partial [Spirochaetales bacterium]|nr:DNA/RNA nuclease SfsA [Spirochaetales bacterium]